MTGGAGIRRVLVIGNNSGAIHGSLVMNRYLVKAITDAGCSVSVLDRAFSRRNTEIGKMKPYKLLKAAGMAANALAMGLHGRFDAAFYLPASLPPALTFDYYYLPLVRHLSGLWIGYSHMVRYKGLSEGPSRFHARMSPRFWQSFDCCIGPSAAVAGDLEAVGVSPGRLRVLPNCLPPGWTFGDEQEAAANASRPVESILFLSTVRARKGIWDLLEAYDAISGRPGGAPSLEIIGPETDAGAFAAIEAWARSKGHSSRIFLRGEQGHREIEERLSRGGSVFVFPTRREEAFGLVLAEAMSKGIPIVATRIGAIPEVLDDGRAGLLVDPADPAGLATAIESLLTDAGMRRNLAVEGLRASRRYSFETYAEGVAGILDWADGFRSRRPRPSPDSRR